MRLEGATMKIIFFDGYCSLCNGAVDWMMARDRKGVLKFASLQGLTAQNVLLDSSLGPADPETVLYFRDGKTYDRSTAILMSCQDLGGLWRFMSLLLIIPKPLRDLIYKWVARHRYRLFGKRDTCRLPAPHEKERILP